MTTPAMRACTPAEAANIVAQLPAAARSDRRLRYADGSLSAPPEFAADLAAADPQRAPAAVIPDITAAQARLWLLVTLGKSDADVEAVIRAIPDPLQSGAALIRWQYDTVYKRSSPLFDALGPALGLTPAQIDAAFLAAAQL